MDVNELRGMPPWLVAFFIHVVGRCAGIVLDFCQAVKEANCQQRTPQPAGSNGRKRLP